VNPRLSDNEFFMRRLPVGCGLLGLPYSGSVISKYVVEIKVPALDFLIVNPKETHIWTGLMAP
jgi:hypothetical protein